MAYKDKLRSFKGAKENTLDKAGKQLEKNSNAGIKKKGHGVVKTKGKMTLDKAGKHLKNNSNDADAGLKKKDHGVTSKEMAGEKVENSVENAEKTAGKGLKKVGNDAVKAGNDAINEFDKEMKEFGNDRGAFDKAITEVKKFGHDVQEAFEKAGEELKKLGNNVQEAFEKAGEELNKLNVFSKASEGEELYIKTTSWPDFGGVPTAIVLKKVINPVDQEATFTIDFKITISWYNFLRLQFPGITPGEKVIRLIKTGDNDVVSEAELEGSPPFCFDCHFTGLFASVINKMAGAENERQSDIGPQGETTPISLQDVQVFSQMGNGPQI